MPKQTSVTLTANADGSYNLQVGPYGFQGQQSQLFGQGFDAQKLGTNLRLAFLIGNFTQPGAQTFISYVNNTLGGVKLPDATYFITEIIDNGGGTYTIGTAPNATAPTLQTFTQSLTAFSQDLQDYSVIVGSIASFLRLGNYTSLTAAALAAVNAVKFWY